MALTDLTDDDLTLIVEALNLAARNLRAAANSPQPATLEERRDLTRRAETMRSLAARLSEGR